MTLQEFNKKYKEYDDAIENDEYDRFYNENKELCSFITEIWNINLALDEDFAVIVDDEFELSLDDEAEEEIQQVLLRCKNRMIEGFELCH